MPFKYPNSQRKPYTQSGIDEATTKIGVYGMFDSDDECTYIGKTEDRSEGIRGRVQDHYNGHTSNSRCINQVYSSTHFRWEDETDFSVSIAERERQLIREYKAKGEAYCNDRVG